MCLTCSSTRRFNVTPDGREPLVDRRAAATSVESVGYGRRELIAAKRNVPLVQAPQVQAPQSPTESVLRSIRGDVVYAV